MHLEHFLYLGVDAIQLGDIFESPMKDLGRDVSNFTNIDPLYGTLQDFKDLVEECHEKGVKHVIFNSLIFDKVNTVLLRYSLELEHEQ